MKPIFIRKIALLLSLFAVITCKQQAFAQTLLESSGALIEEGIKAYDTGNYKRAIELIGRVQEGDTNYVDAQYELVLAYIGDTAYKKAEAIALHAMDHPEAETRKFQLLLASVYDYMSETDKALQLYRQLSASNPNDYQPVFEAGVVHFRKERYDSAAHYFEQSLMIFPGHFKSMRLLGSAYLLQGRLTEAWLCLQTSLLSASNISLARNPINYLEGIVKQTDDFSEPYTNKRGSYTHPLFDETDAILHSRIIVSSDYKIKSVLADEPQAKAAYAIMEKLKYDKDDDNFVMQYIVPLWIAVRDNSLTDPFLLQAYSNFEIEKIDKLAAKEKKDMAKVKDQVYSYINLILATRTLNYEARQKAPLKYKFLSSENLYYVGRLKTPSNFDAGPVTVYRNGTLVATGAFSATGEKAGKWNYYYVNGKRKSTENLIGEKNTGRDTSWYGSGIIKADGRYDEAGTSVYSKEYNENGIATEEYELISNGMVRKNVFYESGAKKLTIMLSKKSYQDGEYDGWYENGKIQRRFTIKNGKLEGAYKEFYDNEQPKAVYYYKEGKLEGSYTAYHPNGKMSFLANYHEGKEEGSYEQWNEAGKQTLKQAYKNGKLDGKKLYLEDGVEYGYVVYADDKPTSYEFKDPEGKVVASGKSPISTLKIYGPNGLLKTELPLKDGLISGLARFYTYGGTLSEEAEFANDKREGKETTYFKNGKVNHESNNKDGNDKGPYKSYHKNGNPGSEGWLEGSDKQGIWTFYNVNGTKDSRAYYNAGEISGPAEEFNIKGELLSKDYYFDKALYRLQQFDSAGNVYNTIDFPNGNGDYRLLSQESKKTWFECKVAGGQFNGPYTKYFPDGSISESGIYKNGRKHGPVTYFYFNGIKSSSGFFKEGKQDSTWQYYTEMGEHIATSNYKAGDLHGKRYSYEDGQLTYESTYEEGSRNGPQYIYSKNKQLAVMMNFSSGILKSYAYEGKDGKLMPEIKLKNGTGAVLAYYPNGKKSADLHYEQSGQQGKQLYYFANGNLSEERNVAYEDNQGEWKEYYENGKLKCVYNYKDNDFYGPYTLYDATGKVLVSKNYYYDQLHGVYEITDAKTGKTRKIQYRYGYAVTNL
jgi:antitoxin component YwqK of YwqJK toxin-antitoxin module/Tfp pilus assembly protein PilF